MKTIIFVVVTIFVMSISHAQRTDLEYFWNPTTEPCVGISVGMDEHGYVVAGAVVARTRLAEVIVAENSANNPPPSLCLPEEFDLASAIRLGIATELPEVHVYFSDNGVPSMLVVKHMVSAGP